MARLGLLDLYLCISPLEHRVYQVHYRLQTRHYSRQSEIGSKRQPVGEAIALEKYNVTEEESAIEDSAIEDSTSTKKRCSAR